MKTLRTLLLGYLLLSATATAESTRSAKKTSSSPLDTKISGKIGQWLNEIITSGGLVIIKWPQPPYLKVTIGFSSYGSPKARTTQDALVAGVHAIHLIDQNGQTETLSVGRDLSLLDGLELLVPQGAWKELELEFDTPLQIDQIDENGRIFSAELEVLDLGISLEGCEPGAGAWNIEVEVPALGNYTSPGHLIDQDSRWHDVLVGELMDGITACGAPMAASR